MDNITTVATSNHFLQFSGPWLGWKLPGLVTTVIGATIVTKIEYLTS
jgi:hypothetical protein